MIRCCDDLTNLDILPLFRKVTSHKTIAWAALATKLIG